MSLSRDLLWHMRNACHSCLQADIKPLCCSMQWLTEAYSGAQSICSVCNDSLGTGLQSEHWSVVMTLAEWLKLVSPQPMNSPQKRARRIFATSSSSYPHLTTSHLGNATTDNIQRPWYKTYIHTILIPILSLRQTFLTGYKHPPYTTLINALPTRDNRCALRPNDRYLQIAHSTPPRKGATTKV